MRRDAAHCLIETRDLGGGVIRRDDCDAG